LTDYWVVAIRILTILPLMLIMTLMMGKRQVGELPVIDFIVAITIGSVVGADIADPRIHHGPTAFAVVLIALFQFMTSRANVKSRLFNHWLTFEPTIVIQNGRILKTHLAKNRITLDTLLELLRSKGIFNLNEVEFAIIEPNGKLSVLKKSQYAPPPAEDLGVQTPYKGIPTPLIVEGKVFPPGLHFTGQDESSLRQRLQKYAIADVKDIFYAAQNSDGSLHVSLYGELHKEQIFRF
jgi:uncharacterized membrane protein YcaP (DUF421 family)